MQPERQGDRTLRGHLNTIRRRKGVILLAMVLVPTAALVASALQAPAYEASAGVVLRQSSIPGDLLGTRLQPSADLPDRVLRTQAEIAHTPTVARRVVRAVDARDLTPQELLRHTNVSARPDADILVFSVRDADPGLARRLVNEYARQYAIHQRRLDRVPVQRALADLARGTGSTPRGANRTARQLRTQEALGIASASYLPTAESASKVSPQTARNGIFGLLLGTVFGIGLAFLWQALDTRLRSAREVSDGLGLPLLARVPAHRRRFEPDSFPVMLSEPQSAEAEAFRFLRANLQFVNRDRGARTIMVTSAHEGEGKSSVAANLAVALASDVPRVTLVDLDLRNPSLARSFDIQSTAGLTDLALGSTTFDQALTTVPTQSGVLRVMTSGPPPPDPAEFQTTRALDSILGELRSTADLVIIDSSPLLGLGDAVMLSRRVDAILLVTRWTVLRGPVLPELKRVLDRCPAEKLGFVLTEAQVVETQRDDLARRTAARI